jgi:hypothetical protein
VADGGRTWTEPRLVFANAAAPDLDQPFYNHQCSYMDAFVDGDTLQMFLPHRRQQVVHLKLRESALATLPTKAELTAALASAPGERPQGPRSQPVVAEFARIQPSSSERYGHSQ